jgi:hypothetical protein
MLVVASLLSLLAIPAPCGVVRAPTAPAALPASIVPTASAATASTLPSYLSVADPASRLQVAGILSAAQGSPTAHAVLKRVAQTAQAHGRPVVVEVSKSKNDLGAYSYDSAVLTLNLQDVGGNPNANVATLVHELVHYMQRDIKLPSDLLETEVESYITDFRVSQELGYKPPADDFNAALQKSMKRGFKPFMRTLHKQYPDNAFLWGTPTRDYQARLQSIIQESRPKLAEAVADRAAKKLVIDQMREIGQPQSEIKAYRQDNVPKIDARIVKYRRLIQWARKDLAILSDSKALRTARAYARSVVRRAREFQKEFTRN